MRILAIDIGGTAIKSAITDEKGHVYEIKETDTKAKNGGPYVMQRALEIAHSYSDFEVIGISTTGQVDSKNGVIVYANENVPNYTGINVKEIFEKEFNIPTFVENDVNSAAVGETHYGAGRDFNDLLCVTYGTGIGGAIVINRQIYGGTNGLAGEFGHIVTHPHGKTCGCGQDGCYEQYASTTALVREAKRLSPDYINGRVIFEDWHKGDEQVKKVVDNWIDEIIIGLVTIIHIFNPNALILGGGILAESYIENEINRRLGIRVMKSYQTFKVRKAELKNTAGLLGASYIAANAIKNK